jgi:hypothetical protein
LLEGLVALGESLIEPPLQLTVGTPEISNDLLWIV